MRRPGSRPTAVLLGLCLLAAGCLTLRESAEASFYLLSAIEEEDAVPQPVPKRVVIGVGPVEIPAYLDRSQIVVRRGPNELRLADFHKWAEPLKDGVSRVVATNLVRLLSVETVFFPWPRAQAVDYQLSLQLARFDSDSEGAATLDVRWSLRDGDGSREVETRSGIYRAPSGSAIFADRVAAMSQVLAELSRDVATALAERIGPGASE